LDRFESSRIIVPIGHHPAANRGDIDRRSGDRRRYRSPGRSGTQMKDSNADSGESHSNERCGVSIGF
jgi:hypothetical protein